MNKFSIGDRVRVLESAIGYGIPERYVGQTGTIDYVLENGDFQVVLDGKKSNRGWQYRKQDLAFVDEKPVESAPEDSLDWACHNTDLKFLIKTEKPVISTVREALANISPNKNVKVIRRIEYYVKNGDIFVLDKIVNNVLFDGKIEEAILHEVANLPFGFIASEPRTNGHFSESSGIVIYVREEK